MSPAVARTSSTAPRLALVPLAGVLLGVLAQLLRQVEGSAMALGGATAPWLTIGFLIAVLASRQRDSFRAASGHGVATAAVYLLTWLASYHATFAIRESVTQAAAWREAAPWLLLAGPVSAALGVAAAVTHKEGALGDLCLALPVAWSMPEVLLFLWQGWVHVIVVALPTVILAFSPFLAVGRGDVKLLRVLLYCGLFGVVSLAVLPILRNLIHS
jgi:hypothetical protein